MSDDKATKKDLYEKLWSARDFELTHQWQRSIFLATFIVLLFTLYFTFVGIIADYHNNDVTYNVDITSSLNSDEANFNIRNAGKVDDESGFNFLSKWLIRLLLLEVICVAGYSFSVLWICMAKGSKYMYERLEAGINESYERDFFDDDTKETFYREKMDNLWNLGDYTFVPRHGNLPQSEYDYKMFSLNGAKFSSSKINILIGYILCIAWIALMFSSYYIANEECFSNQRIVILLIVLVIIGIPFFLSPKVHSGEWGVFNHIFLVVESLFARKNAPLKRQIKYIARVVNEKFSSCKIENSNSLRFIALNTKTVLKKYSERTDNLREKILLQRSAQEKKLLKKHIRRILSDDRLRNILETSLMYRRTFNTYFKGNWKSNDGTTEITIKDSSLDIVSSNFLCFKNNCDACNNVIKLELAGDSPFTEVRFFADTDWKKIRTGDEYDLFGDARVYHVIAKNDYADLYFHLNCKSSLADNILVKNGKKMNATMRIFFNSIGCKETNRGSCKKNFCEMKFTLYKKSTSSNS